MPRNSYILLSSLFSVAGSLDCVPKKRSMSSEVGNDIVCFDFLRSMEEKSYVKRSNEKCNTGGSCLSSVYLVAS